MRSSTRATPESCCATLPIWLPRCAPPAHRRSACGPNFSCFASASSRMRDSSAHNTGSKPMRYALLLLLACCLAGCGDSTQDRASGGAATGAGTGAVIGLVGGPVGVALGALIGGGVGAASGAAVPEKHLDLGPPPWSDEKPRQSAAQ